MGACFTKESQWTKVYSILLRNMSNKTCHHIHQMKGFFHICFIKLSSVYTLVYQNKKSSQSVGGPICLMRWPPLPKLLGKGGHFESKSIWLIIKIRYPETLSVSAICIYIAYSLHRTVIGFKIARIFSLNTIETLSGSLCPPFPYATCNRLGPISLNILDHST